MNKPGAANDSRAADPNQIRLGTRVADDPDGFGQAGEPLYVSRDLLREAHVHVRGRTRSGKTSQAIAPLAKQLLRSYPVHYHDANGEPQVEQVRDAVFVFDLGGDLTLFNQLKAWSGSNPPGGPQDKRQFRFISLARGDAWDYFDPFQSIESDEVSIIQIANMLVQAFHLDHGLVYGGSYYTQQNLAALLGVTRRLRDNITCDESRSVNLRDVVEQLEKTVKHQRDAEQIRLTFDFLLEYKQLQPPAGEDRVIRMDRALQDGEVTYFFCPTMGESTTARQIAGLGLYTLINAAMQRLRTLSVEDRYRPLPHAWIFVDEFQELAGRSFAALLAQASKFGISVLMANQTTAQLKNKDLDLSHIVRDNTLLKMYFTITGKEDIEDLQAFSKEMRIELGGETISGGLGSSSVSASTREIIVPTLLKDDILRTSSATNECFVILDGEEGHQEPIRLRPEYAIEKADFDALKRTPLPRAQASRSPACEAMEVSKSKQLTAWDRARSSPSSKKRQETLGWLLELKRKQENPQELARLCGMGSGQ